MMNMNEKKIGCGNSRNHSGKGEMMERYKWTSRGMMTVLPRSQKTDSYMFVSAKTAEKKIAALEAELERVTKELWDSHCITCNCGRRAAPGKKGYGCSCAEPMPREILKRLTAEVERLREALDKTLRFVPYWLAKLIRALLDNSEEVKEE